MKKLAVLMGLSLMLSYGTADAQEVKEKTKKGWSKKAKGAVIGGAAGAGVGAVVGGTKGAVIGTAIGAGGGYLYGKHRDKKYPEKTIKYKRKVKYRD